MARYFRYAADDLALLPSSIAERDDLEQLAADAEDDILDLYTRPDQDPGQLAVVLDAGAVVERYVWLKGYAVDPNSAHPAFAAAFRREIAAAIRWRAGYVDKKANLSYESAGDPNTAKTYRADAERRLPPDFGRALRSYAIGRTHWVL